MKKVVILGNGFDLIQKYKTRFYDGRDYLLSFSHEDTDFQAGFTDMFENADEKKWSMFEEESGMLLNSLYTRYLNGSSDVDSLVDFLYYRYFDDDVIEYARTGEDRPFGLIEKHERHYHEEYDTFIEESFIDIEELKSNMITFIANETSDRKERKEEFNEILKESFIINYNYSKTYDVYEYGDVFHIHGSLDDKLEDIGLGVYDNFIKDPDALDEKIIFERIVSRHEISFIDNITKYNCYKLFQESYQELKEKIGVFVSNDLIKKPRKLKTDFSNIDTVYSIGFSWSEIDRGALIGILKSNGMILNNVDLKVIDLNFDKLNSLLSPLFKSVEEIKIKT